MDIPFNRPHLAGRELLYVAQTVLDGHTAGNGPFTRRCEAALAELTGCPKVLLTTSATSALELAALLCEVGPGDEVILPSYAFVTCANAFVLRGATPVFVDVSPETMNIEAGAVAAAITPRTKAILVLHYAGVSCDMDPLLELAGSHGVPVIEDAAQGLGSRYKGRPLGTMGALGAISFHETKNVICGEGGALLVNDPALRARAEILRDKGTDRARFLRGEVDKYTWQDVGSSWVPSDILAAFLYAQLEEAERIMARRLEVWERYHEGLAELGARGLARLPQLPADCVPNGHLFYLLTRSAEERTRLIAHLKAVGIMAVFHYVPLHTSPMGRRLCDPPPTLPVTEDLSARLVRLPLYFNLDEVSQGRVVAAVREFYGC